MSATSRSGAAGIRFRQRLYIRDRGVCQICLRPVSLEEFTIDHVIPKSKGGPDKQENLQIAHDECNQKKSDKVISLHFDGTAWSNAV